MRDQPGEAGFLSLIDGLDEAGEEDLLRALSLHEAQGIDADWPSWAHHGQLPPDGDWRTWVIMAGRGFGKTRAGAEWVMAAVRGGSSPPARGRGLGGGPAESAQCPPPNPLPQAGGEIALRIALVAATLDEARRVMVEGRSGLLNVAADWIEEWHPSLRQLKFKGGAEATLFSGASPEALRGPEHHLAWCDELAKWEQPEATWDMLQLGL
ncbi:MAG: terminase family protein, partial [Sphingomonas sp.]